jgi:hypothetical protein
MSSTPIVESIREHVAAVTATDAFVSWLDAEKGLSEGDLVALNNSFVYRDGVKTVKNPAYPCLRIASTGVLDTSTVVIGEPSSFNADFKRFSAKGSLPQVHELDSAVDQEVAKLGRLVLLLVGAIDDTLTTEVEVRSGLIKMLRYDPTAQTDVDINAEGVVTLNRLHDPEAVWTGVQERAKAAGLVEDALPDGLEAPFADAFQRLQAEARSLLRLPNGVPDSLEGTVVERLTNGMNQQLNEYEAALERSGGDASTDTSAFADVLRIAYSFAGEARNLIDLIVSICDLKPVLLWCTLDAHFALAENFRALPWTKSKKKPSLDRYAEMIARARNRAFHDLIPFDRSLEVDVAGLSLQTKRLMLFGPYQPRGSGILEFEDQELLDVLMRFSRAPETSVPLAFWERNASVMRGVVELLQAVGEALMLLQRERSMTAE